MNVYSFRPLLRTAALATVVSGAMAMALPAQQTAPPPTPAQAVDLSGMLFGSYGYRTDSAAAATLGGRQPNQFGLDRAYVTLRMPAGENGAIRVTTDIFQNSNSNSYSGGWAVRIKYAYAQYTGLRDRVGPGSSFTGRIGVLHTVIIDQQEQYWPRYLGQVALDRNGFFSSADAGAAALLTLGSHWGEVYGTITNGPGYTAAERDRFKDLALRVSLTPLANRSSLGPILQSLTISPWMYKGWTASTFAGGGAGQIGSGENGAMTDGLHRDRYGIFAAVRDRRLTAGVELTQRMDEGSEGGLNTTAAPRTLRDSTGRLADAFVIVRPAEWFDASRRSPFSVVARIDRYTPSTSPQGASYAGTVPRYDYTVLGASYDLNARMTLAVDWQRQSPSGFPPPTGGNVRATPRASTVFLHWQAIF
jgi:hypothetical protein